MLEFKHVTCLTFQSSCFCGLVVLMTMSSGMFPFSNTIFAVSRRGWTSSPLLILRKLHTQKEYTWIYASDIHKPDLGIALPVCEWVIEVSSIGGLLEGTFRRNHWTYHLEKWCQETYPNDMPSHFNLIFNQPVIIQNARNICKEIPMNIPQYKHIWMYLVLQEISTSIHQPHIVLFALGPLSTEKITCFVFFQGFQPGSIKFFQALPSRLDVTSIRQPQAWASSE